MKKFLSIATIMVMVLLMFTSCVNEDEPKTNCSYVGTYYGTENLSGGNYTDVVEQYQYTLTLRPDKTFTIIDDDVYYEEAYHYDGTYTYIEKENILYLTPVTESYYNWGEFEYSKPYTDEGFYLKSNDDWQHLLVSYDGTEWEYTPLLKISDKY